MTSHNLGSMGRPGHEFGVGRVRNGSCNGPRGRGYGPKTAILHCTLLVGKRGPTGQTRRNGAARDPRTPKRTRRDTRVWNSNEKCANSTATHPTRGAYHDP